MFTCKPSHLHAYVQDVHAFQFRAGDYSDAAYAAQAGVCAQAYMHDSELKQEVARTLFASLCNSKDMVPFAVGSTQHNGLAFAVVCSAAPAPAAAWIRNDNPAEGVYV